MKEAMKRILTITDNHPPLGKEWLPSEAQAMCDGMQEIHVIALEATSAAAVERNADGDSLEEIKAEWAPIKESEPPKPLFNHANNPDVLGNIRAFSLRLKRER